MAAAFGVQTFATGEAARRVDLIRPRSFAASEDIASWSDPRGATADCTQRVVLDERPALTSAPRLTHPPGSTYHSPAPKGVFCGMALPVAPT